MKKKVVIPIVIIVILTIAYFWWSAPVHFLSNTNPDDIIRIEIFNGDSGNDFVIEDQGDINSIVSNIQSISMKKNKISLGYMGTQYNLKFIDTEGETVDEFIINHYNTLRKDPFFYIDSTSSLCIDLLNSIEETKKED